MKIEAHVIGPEIDGTAKISIDKDYVEANEDSIREWIETELYDLYGKNIYKFEITNLEDVIVDLEYDEYCDKTQYARY